MAQEVVTLAPVVVTATRIPVDPKSVAAGITVIDASDLRSVGAQTVYEGVRWLAGVPSRVNTGGGADQALDLRGFGETAGSNVVVLVDGVRQNEGDLSGSDLSWLDIDSVQRIEILRGSAAVLHGEGATGGVINVVTHQGLDAAGVRVGGGIGSNGTLFSRASVSGLNGPWHWQVSGSAQDSDQHRQNFHRHERNGLVSLGWSEGGTLLSARLGAQTAATGLPGGLTPAEAAQTPKASFKPQDKGTQDAKNLLLSAEFGLADWRMALDINRRVSTVFSDYVSDAYQSNVGIGSSRQAVRAWRQYNLAGLAQRTLLGLDNEQWDSSRTSEAAWGGSLTEVQQHSTAAYVRQELGASDQSWRLFGGLRRTLAERSASGAQGGRIDPANTSWETGSVHQIAPGTEAFWRWGTSFRLPNVDEFSCYVGYAGCSNNSVSLLKPQTSKDLEIGWRQKSDNATRALRVYQSRLTNEIGLDATQFNNVNYDPTQRRGVEAEARWKVAPGSLFGLVLNLRNATFVDGAFAGKSVPLVSGRTLTLHWQQDLGNTRTFTWLTQLQSSQLIAGDLDNACPERIGGFGVTRLRYAQELAGWDWALNLNNVFDRQYYNFRTRCDATKRSVYPEAGRTWLMTAQRKF
ncbi:MAG: hypothetical protein RL323_2244 [Pseudomonadota bacterium]